MPDPPCCKAATDTDSVSMFSSRPGAERSVAWEGEGWFHDQPDSGGGGTENGPDKGIESVTVAH